MSDTGLALKECSPKVHVIASKQAVFPIKTQVTGASQVMLITSPSCLLRFWYVFLREFSE